MHVVLVDPSRTVLKFVSRLLEARGDTVQPFIDGRAALAYIKEDPRVGALITSAEPLSMSGLELCWETRLLTGEKRSIYVILMSSNQERRNLVEALDSGADDFIGKPPVAEELYARLRAGERLASMHRDLVQLASLDSLSGLLNRRAFFERAEEIRAQLPAIGTVSAIMLDIDHFKRINDVHGHAIGDRAIQKVASAIAAAGKIVGRLGGEEFAVLLPGSDLAAARQVAERLRQEISLLPLRTDGEPNTFTGSFGVSEWQPGDTVDKMLRRADMALYAAKAAGRNRVVVADEALNAAHYNSGGRPVRAAHRPDVRLAPEPPAAEDRRELQSAAG